VSYEDIEISAEDGRPVELYEFRGVTGDFFYTSHQRQVTFNANVYTPVAGLTRRQLSIGVEGGASSSTLEVLLPYNLDLAREYAYGDAPPQLSFTLWRGHLSDPDEAYRAIWQGEVTTWSVKGLEARLKIPSIFAVALSQNMPPRRWQGPCNHVLYDSRCGVNRNDHAVNTTVTAISSGTVTVANLPWTGNEGVGGELVVLGSNERRMITATSGTAISIQSSFSAIAVGDNVIAYEGCDHSAETCRDKFNNFENFGGFNLIPGLNPFLRTLR